MFPHDYIFLSLRRLAVKVYTDGVLRGMRGGVDVWVGPGLLVLRISSCSWCKSGLSPGPSGLPTKLSPGASHTHKVEVYADCVLTYITMPRLFGCLTTTV